MSLIIPTKWRAIDSAGNPYVGATLTIYQVGTTTLASIYRDAAMTQPMTNPTSGSDKSDAAGYFPQFYAAEGVIFDVTLKDAGGVTRDQQLSVPSVGSGAATITRDFGSGGRLRINGSGGVVSFEGGNPSGSDVGGQVRIGGYNGTQAEALTLDAASANFTGQLTTSLMQWLSLTDAATVAWNTALGFNAKVTLGGNRTIGAPSPLVDGMTYQIQLIQDATGSRTVTWNSIWDFGVAGAPTLPTAAGKRILVTAVYDATYGKLITVAVWIQS